MKTRTILIIIGVVAIAGLFSGLLAWGLTRDNENGPIVITNIGQIRGLRATDGEYSKFLGIPYAVVDEANPFGPSTPHPGFETLFEATEGSTACPQVNGNVAMGGIQCLELDIHVPDSATLDNPLPVMVWIHGGGWVLGTNQREGSTSHWLHSKDVIVVAINYRLGVYGFLCLDTPEYPGNQGLKDQIIALRWINENIAAFGGDQNKITAFGGSAGGMSANLHLYSPHEKLFDQAIIQSGPALSYWLMNPSYPDIPFNLTEYFGYNANTLSDAMSYLTSLEPLRLVQAAFDLGITSLSGGNQPLTKPCVEKVFPGVESFLPEHPMNLRSTKVQDMDIIIGFNDQELGNFHSNDDDFFRYRYQLTDQFNLGFTEHEDLEKALEIIKHFYVGDEEFTKEIVQDIVNYGTDIIFGHSTHRMIKQLIRDGARNVYSFVFSHAGQRTGKIMNGILDAPGALHGDEIGYLFDLVTYSDPVTDEDQLVIDRMTTMWTNFAKFSDPTPSTSELLQVQWVPVTNTSVLPHMDINAELTVSGRPNHARMAFWDLFYEKYASYQMWYNNE